MKRRLLHILFYADSRFTEVTIGGISILLGLWFGLDWLHGVVIPLPASTPGGMSHTMMHICGILLFASGMTKLVANGFDILLWRKQATASAFCIWLFVAVAFRDFPLPGIRYIFAPYISLINFIIFIRLSLLLNYQERTNGSRNP